MCVSLFVPVSLCIRISVYCTNGAKMSSKRGSYKSLELSKKFEILQRLRKGESAVKLSQEFGIPRTSVNDI